MSQENNSEGFNPQSQRVDSSTPYKQPKARITDMEGSWGKWSDQENLHYIMFMDYYQKIFNSRERRRLTKIFKAMADSMKTRTAIQCRSHHQKLIGKYGNFKKIIGVFKGQQKRTYHEKFEVFSSVRRNIHEDSWNVKEESESETKSVMIQTEPVVIINVNQQTDLAGVNYYLPQFFNPAIHFPAFFPGF